MDPTPIFCSIQHAFKLKNTLLNAKNVLHMCHRRYNVTRPRVQGATVTVGRIAALLDAHDGLTWSHSTTALPRTCLGTGLDWPWRAAVWV